MSKRAEVTAKPTGSRFIARPKTVVSAKLSNPKSLTELAANKLEQTIRPKTKPKSLVQLAAEKIEQSIKQPAVLPKPRISNIPPTLRQLAAQALVKDKIKFWENKAHENASVITYEKRPISIVEMREEELNKIRLSGFTPPAHFRICLRID